MWRRIRKSKDEFSNHFKGLAAAGFILPNGKMPTNFQIFWFLSVWTCYFLFIALTMVEFVVQPYNLRRTLFTIFMANNGFQTLFRPIQLILFKFRVEQLLVAFQVKPDNEYEHFCLEEQKMRERSTLRIHKFSAILYTYNTLLLLRTVIPAIIRMAKVSLCEHKPDLCDEESTPLYIVDFWWYADRFKTPTYYYLYTYNVICVSIYILIFCTSDAFTCSTMVALVERGDFLIKMAETELKPNEGGQMTPMFKAWIKYHQHYEKLVQMVNQAIGPLVLLTHVFAAGNIMVYGFLILKDKEQEIRNLAFSFLSVTVIQFFMYAYWGQQVINKGDELSRATLSANQVAEGAYQGGPVTSALMVVMTRCCGENRSAISGMGFFCLSFKLYAKIFGLSLSYLLIVLQF